jgi:hypothetical protein
MFKPEAKYQKGDLVVFNEQGRFGNDKDELFHIHSVRYGTTNSSAKKQYWYSGNLLKIGEYESKGLPQVPVFSTTLTNAFEDSLKGLEHLVLKK